MGSVLFATPSELTDSVAFAPTTKITTRISFAELRFVIRKDSLMGIF
jgi:hypothetical protein